MSSLSETHSEEAVSRGIPLSSGDEKILTPSKGLTSAEAEKLLLKYGRNELEDKHTPKVSLSNLAQPCLLANSIGILIA